LHEFHAEDLTRFACGRLKVRIGPDDEKAAVFFAAQDVESGGLVTRGDNAVGYDPSEKRRRGLVNRVGERHEIPEGTLRVGTSSPHIGGGRRR
jgi:hypothetical protein